MISPLVVVEVLSTVTTVVVPSMTVATVSAVVLNAAVVSDSLAVSL
jgi:hypothetical protein